MALQKIPFAGGSNPGFSPYADVESSINLFPAPVESSPSGMSSGSTVSQGLALFGTPGLSALAALLYGARALFVTGDGRLFAVAGQYFYEVFVGTLSGSTELLSLTGSPFTYMAGFGPTTLVIDGMNYAVASVAGPTQLFITPASITAATNATAAVFSTLGPAPETGATITVSGFTGGWTSANNTFTVTRLSGFSFSIPLNSTGFGALSGIPVFTPNTGGASYLGYCQRNGSYLFSTATTPAVICYNGTQFLIAEAGDVYVDADDGNGPTPSTYQNGSGTVKTSGTALTWLSGSQFDQSNLIDGNLILISGAYYSTASVPGATSLTLTGVNMMGAPGGVTAYNPTQCFLTFDGAPPPPETGATITVSGFTGRWAGANGTFTCTRTSINSFTFPIDSSAFGTPTGAGIYTPGVQDTAYSGTVTTSGTAVTWVSGSTFDATLQAAVLAWAQNGNVVTITINGVAYAISSITDIHDLVLTSSAGTQTSASFAISIGVAYSATYPVTAQSITYLDGYGIAAKPNSRQINISANGDFTQWNPIDNALVVGMPDDIVSVFADHETLYILKEQSAESWQDNGAAAFPFQRNTGGFVPHGCIATNSVCQFAEGIAWLGGDYRGQPRMYYAQGLVPQPISTESVEFQWSQYIAAGNTLSDAVSYSYAELGFTFLVITFPTANATWAYELSTERWHQRASGAAPLNQQIQMFHAFAFGQHIVAGPTSSLLYAQSMSTYTEDIVGGSPQLIVRQRTFRVPFNKGNDWAYLSAVRQIAENMPSVGSAITAVTNASAAQLTTTLVTGSTVGDHLIVRIAGFTGNWTAANGDWVALNVSTGIFTIPVDSTAFGASAGSPTAAILPKPMFSYSKDGGVTYANVGYSNPPTANSKFGFWDWRRLGRARDWVLRMQMTSPTKAAFTAVEVDIE